jgi:hypothetical protein
MKDESFDFTQDFCLHPSSLILYFCFRYERVRVTLRCLRPRWRRAARTLRPPFVFMRARKPCVRIRFMRLGWYTRFTNQVSLSS